MTLFLVIFILESLKFRLLFQRKHGEGCSLYWLDIAPARKKPQIKSYKNNLYALTRIKSTNLTKHCKSWHQADYKSKDFPIVPMLCKKFFNEIFLLTIFSLIFCMQTIYFKWENNGLSLRLLISNLNSKTRYQFEILRKCYLFFS